jgi:hypothetical protein
MIKVGNDHFEVSHLEPKVDVCDKHYVFDAVAPAGSNKPLNFSPRGPCPAFEVDPQIAGPAMDKQQNDEYQLAQLTKDNVATAPLDPGTDGGMNRVFMTKLENPTYTYDNEGHLHVPPLQPGRLPPQISASATPTVSANGTPISNGGSSVGNFFSGMFAKGSPSSTSEVASASTDTSAQTHTGFFGSLFSSSHDTAPPPADTETTTATTTPPKPKPTTGLRPRINTEPQVAKTTGSVSSAPAPAQSSPPQKEANVAAPPPSNNGVINGAQPVVPAGTFNNRWGGFQ